MAKILVIVDMQNDFITGALGSPEALEIVPYVREKMDAAHKNGDIVFTTRDEHDGNYANTQEGRMLPVEHCQKGTQGFEPHPVIKDGIEPDTDYCVCKSTFGSFDLVNELLTIEASGTIIDEIELCGVCTDICVVSNAILLKTAFPEVPMVIDAAACAGVTPEKHKAALEVLKSIQVNVIGG